MTMGTSNKETIIEVKNISKQYNIGMDRTYKTFAESFTNVLKSPIKSLRSIGYQHDTFCALKDINFNVNRGEVVGIIGRNGAGKSTLLKILSRITTPTEGEIRLKGRVGSLLEVGTGFHPELTGRENIYFNGAILGMKKKEIDDKFDEIVTFSGVDKFLDTPVKRYSSGMQVRLAFSVAANLEPEILLVDEVLAVGDASFQKKCLGKMGEVAEGGRTVLFVSHNMGAITNLCTRCLAIESGSVHMNGETEEVVSSYLEKILPKESFEKDLSNIARRTGVGKKLKITGIKIHHNGESLRFKDPLVFDLVIESYEDLENTIFGIGINTIQGQRLITVESEDYQIPVTKDRKIEIKVNIPNPGLPPSKYLLSVGARSGGNYSIDSVPEAMVFEISPRANELILEQRSHLGIRPDAEWIFQKL